MSHRGGMQLKPAYKQQLDSRFLKWYLREFKNDRMIYIHWSAGLRSQVFPAYHVMIVANAEGDPGVVHNRPVTQDHGGHTYQRNTNSIGVCVASMHGATSANFGKYYPLPAQLARLVTETRAICCNHRIPVANIMTHAEAADNVDGAQGLDYYGPENGCERWDFHCWINPTTLQLSPPSRGCPAGWEYFPDWLRGQVALKIQTACEKYWKR